MNEPFDLLEELTERYGAVKRARGCYLYTQSGNRITDLWLDGGRAILGWGAGKARMHFKNSIERGFSGVYGTAFPHALKKALNALVGGGFAFYAFYTDSSKTAEALKCAGLSVGNVPKFLPWLDYGLDLPPLPHAKQRKPAVYCTDAALEQERASRKADCVEIVLPFSWQPATVLAFKDSALQQKVPASDGIPAPLCEAFCRAVYDLRLALPSRSAEDWAVFDNELSPYWHRIGPYLRYKGSKESYGAFFKHCLEQKLLISPSFDSFSIVPIGANSGVFSLLRSNRFSE